MSGKQSKKKQREAVASGDAESSRELSQESVLQQFWNSYGAKSSPRVKLIDLFMFYLICVILLQVFYRAVVGNDFPRNAFVSGVGCPLGVIVLLKPLRSAESQPGYRAVGEFTFAAFILFIACVNFVG